MEATDAYHLSGLYSHHEDSNNRQTSTNASSRQASTSGSGSSTRATNSGICRASTSRQSSTNSNSGRWRHHTPAIVRNNSNASNCSSSSGICGSRENFASLPVSPDGISHAHLELEKRGNHQIPEVECEDINASSLLPDTSLSLMEASTVTASTVDSSAELLHRFVIFSNVFL